ncbi:MAG: response regulator receiver domain [Lentimicrobium sp.]
MNSPFFETSKVVANQFLQNIVFIDDKAFKQPGNSNHDFNALKISQVFAQSQKVCATYKPNKLVDIDNLAELAKKADVTVLDWQINIEQDKVEDEEEDAVDDDPRGPHTKRIIKSILTDPLTGQGSLKLIVIYTGETDLNGITDEVYDDLVANDIKKVDRQACQIKTENAKILIIAKPDPEENGEPKFKHTPELNQFVVSYEDLPTFILTEFSKMTSGLLSNFALNSLSVLRNNTFRLLSSFDKELDAGFILHRILLPIQEDSGNHLVEIFSESIKAILNYSKSNELLETGKLNEWIEQRSFGKEIQVSGKSFVVDPGFVKDCIEKNFIEAIALRWGEDINETQLKKIASYYNRLFIEKPDIFIGENEENSNEKFSILTHHRSNYKLKSTIPRLNLGTIIKEFGGERYFLCIQAKCDSVRIQEERKFLFLELQVAKPNAKFHFIVESESSFVHLKIIKDSFGLRTIKFSPRIETQTILANIEDNIYFFESNYGERFLWMADLNDAQAQRVANNYASQLSRVGLDESEWLRRWASLV